MAKNGDDKLLMPDIFDDIKLLESFKTFQKLCR